MKYKLKPLKSIDYQMYYILLFILTDTLPGIILTCSDYFSNAFRWYIGMVFAELLIHGTLIWKPVFSR